MSKVTVGQLRNILENALNQIEGEDSDRVLEHVTNTYFIQGVMYYVSIAGVGFVNIEEVKLEDEDEEEDEEA